MCISSGSDSDDTDHHRSYGGPKERESPEGSNNTRSRSSPGSSSGSSDARPQLVFGIDALMEMAEPLDKYVTPRM